VRENEKRRQIIKESYYRALAEGDRNVYFVDGSKMFPEYCREDCTVDGCHPTELGYHFMANAFGEVIAELLEKKK
jgi:lysophospholipase L1-like esterase